MTSPQQLAFAAMTPEQRRQHIASMGGTTDLDGLGFQRKYGNTISENEALAKDPAIDAERSRVWARSGGPYKEPFSQASDLDMMVGSAQGAGMNVFDAMFAQQRAFNERDKEIASQQARRILEEMGIVRDELGPLRPSSGGDEDFDLAAFLESQPNYTPVGNPKKDTLSLPYSPTSPTSPTSSGFVPKETTSEAAKNWFDKAMNWLLGFGGEDEELAKDDPMRNISRVDDILNSKVAQGLSYIPGVGQTVAPLRWLWNIVGDLFDDSINRSRMEKGLPPIDFGRKDENPYGRDPFSMKTTGQTLGNIATSPTFGPMFQEQLLRLFMR